MAIAMHGLRLKPAYEQLINVAVSDGLEQIQFPNRDSTFLRNGFILSQLDGEGMRVMEDQQKRHIKEVYMDSALRSLASDRSSDSVSNFSFESAHTQNTATERINAMLTESVNARKAEYFDLSGNDMEPPHELDSSASSSSAVPNYSRNHIPIDDYFNSIRGRKNKSMLREMETERRSQETIDNNTKMFQEELLKLMVNMKYNICNHNRLLMIYYDRCKPKYHHLMHLVTTSLNRYFLKIL